MLGSTARIVGLALLGLLPAAGTPLGQQANHPRASRLFKDAREMLAIARAQGRDRVSLLVAAKPGRAVAVAEQAARIGGEVRYQEDEIGYLRVVAPIDRVTELVEHDAIESVTLDVTTRDPFRLGSADRPRSLGVADAPAPQDPPRRAVADTTWPPRWSDYPLRHAYSPIKDLDAAELRVRHPTFDGRGVTIVLLDGNVDFLLPEFQTAYTLAGKVVPKIADYLNVTDPRDDADEVPQWVDMRSVATANGRQIEIQGKTFTAPRDGPFRVGAFSERRFNDPSNGEYLGQDIDRNGNPRGDDGLFGILWDEQTNDVWVDTDRDLSFADEKPMTDYRVRGDLGVFGKDDPKTPMRDAIGFAVQTDPRNKFVSINVGIYQHATEIMGSVIGNRYPNGRLQGVAPGARLISMFYGVSNAHGMIEGLIAALKHPLSDLIVLEQSVAIASLSYLLTDARHPVSIIVQRLIDKYQKLVFVPGDNAPGFAYVAEDGAARGAMSVGGYQNRESYRLNNGFVPEPADNLHWGALSHGPSGIGALKPDLLAPSGQMSTDIGYLYRQTEQELRGLYQLPAGYAVDGGTSTATPMAAGATALVLSAAKQTGVSYDAVRLKAALTGGARQIPRLAAHEQGNGLIQVGAAYNLLNAMQRAPMVTITSRAPVRTKLSHLLASPHEGVGIYEREGWSVGDRGTRAITFTRTSGPVEPMTFSVAWLGNDGTFASAASVTLPLNQPVGLPIAIVVATPGAHSAILSLEHPTVPGAAYRVLNTIVAPLHFTADSNYSVTADVTVPRPGDRSVFVEVPAGVAALTFQVSSEEKAIRMNAISPERDYHYPCGFTAPPGQPCAIANPEPGVWEINANFSFAVREYDPGRPRPISAVAAKVTATIVGVGVAADLAATRSTAGPADLPISLTNRLGAISAVAEGGALGSAFRTHRSIGPGEQHRYEVMVPKGATSLRVVVNEVADSAADLDLYLIDCSAPDKPPAPAPPETDRGNKAPSLAPANCSPRAKAATVRPDGQAEIRNPAAGRWVVVVDAYAVSGQTSYAYLDVITHPKLGSVSVTDVAESRAQGAGWTATAHAWVASAPEPGRILVGRIAVVARDLKAADGSAITLGLIDLDPDLLRPR